MYIALTTNKGLNRYFLRQTYETKNGLAYRNLFDLGPDPSRQIVYAGGNAFYFDEVLEDTLSNLEIVYDPDDLEELFWPWVRPDVKRAIETFRHRSSIKLGKLSKEDKEQIRIKVHPFDKRRTHFLKFGNMDQGPLENMPVTLFRNHIQKSRDELEQHFLRQEFSLKSHELKSYVYTIFDLQSYFSGFLAKQMPHALDQNKVDTYFLKELCEHNFKLFAKQTDLNEYMKRYLFMFFDHQYAGTRLLDDFVNDFIFRQRNQKPTPPKNIPVRNALKTFNLTKKAFMQMTKKELSKHYRALAKQIHPDTGGSNEEFVELNNAYESLLSRISEQNFSI
jgi:DnaJ domain